MMMLTQFTSEITGAHLSPRESDDTDNGVVWIDGTNLHHSIHVDDPAKGRELAAAIIAACEATEAVRAQFPPCDGCQQGQRRPVPLVTREYAATFAESGQPERMVRYCDECYEQAAAGAQGRPYGAGASDCVTISPVGTVLP